uniref:Uncharacterized protein n=1 Tax=Romanomermis culicivorax TaxID=13658 RepID=A0A915J233_ROMCU
MDRCTIPGGAMVVIIGGPGRIAGVAKKIRGSTAGAIGGNIAAGSTACIVAGWMGMDLSIGTGARFEISLSISFKKLVICVAVAVISDGAAGIGRADTSVDGGSFAMFKSKIGVSKSSSSAGSTSTPKVGHSSNSLAVSVCTEAIVGMGQAYTGAGNKNRFWKLMMLMKVE